MYSRQHEVKYKWNNIIITAHMTQTELAKLLITPGIHLESVNATKKPFVSHKRKSKN